MVIQSPNSNRRVIGTTLDRTSGGEVKEGIRIISSSRKRAGLVRTKEVISEAPLLAGFLQQRSYNIISPQYHLQPSLILGLSCFQ